MPAEIRDSGWFGFCRLAVLATYTAIVMGIPILMLYRVRIARIALTMAAAFLTWAVILAHALEPLWSYVLVMTGAVLMWLPQSNQYMRKRIHHGNRAIL